MKGIKGTCAVALIAAAVGGCGDDGPTSPAVGMLTIDVVTSGSRLDPDGYVLAVVGGDLADSRQVSTVERVVLDDLTPGEYSIQLTEIAPNCYVEGDTPVDVAVAERDAATVTIAIRCFAPLENEIVFSSNRDGNAELYAIRPDGGGERRLTFTDVSEGRPAVSPDGTRIAFVARTGTTLDGPLDLFVMRADGTGRSNLTNDGAAESRPAWSPDGTRIAFGSDPPTFESSSILILELDGTGPGQLTGSDAQSDWDPAWSPDGSRVVFSRGVGTAQIYTMRTDGSGLVQLTNSPGLKFYPAWASDGTEIVYMGQPDSSYDIYRVSVDGGELTRLTSRPGTDARPAWSPDGDSIVFASDAAGSNHLFIMARDGSGRRQLTFGDWSNTDPDWAE